MHGLRAGAKGADSRFCFARVKEIVVENNSVVQITLVYKGLS